MSDITVTAAKVGIVFPRSARVRTFVAAAAITRGQPVYITAAGTVGVADGNGSSPLNRFRGIALDTVGAGQATDVLQEGEVYGYDLSGMAYDDTAYVSDTAGSLATAAGSTSLVVGKVVPISDKDLTKVLKVTGFAG